MWLLGDAAPIPTWSQLGELGIVAVALLFGAALVYQFGVKPERDRANMERAKRDELSEKMIPLLAQLPATLTEFSAEARGLIAEVRGLLATRRGGGW